MADFKTHLTVSTVLGIGYGTAGHLLYQFPVESCILAGGLCSVSGMLPDIDSDSGVPQRESLAMAAAIAPILLVDRLHHLHCTPETIVLVCAAVYLFIRFGLGYLLKRFTVHRGMWHSLPACALAGVVAFLLVCTSSIEMRLFKSGGVVLGFLSHLVLDEIWALRFGLTGVRTKKSFGTALKLWGDNPWANFSTYAKLAAASFLAFGDPLMMEKLGAYEHQVPQTARDWLDKTLEQGGKLLR